MNLDAVVGDKDSARNVLAMDAAWSPSHSVVNPRLPEIVRDLVENDRKNHGTYVRFVAHASEDLLQSGLISEVGKDTLVSSAAESSCGIKKQTGI